MSKKVFRKPDDLRSHYRPRHRITEYKSPVVAWESTLDREWVEDAKGEGYFQEKVIVTKKNKSRVF